MDDTAAQSTPVRVYKFEDWKRDAEEIRRKAAFIWRHFSPDQLTRKPRRNADEAAWLRERGPEPPFPEVAPQDAG